MRSRRARPAERHRTPIRRRPPCPSHGLSSGSSRVVSRDLPSDKQAPSPKSQSEVIHKVKRCKHDHGVIDRRPSGRSCPRGRTRTARDAEPDRRSRPDARHGRGPRSLRARAVRTDVVPPRPHGATGRISPPADGGRERLTPGDTLRTRGGSSSRCRSPGRFEAGERSTTVQARRPCADGHRRGAPRAVGTETMAVPRTAADSPHAVVLTVVKSWDVSGRSTAREL
jgi:hypothetical protein